MMKKILTNYPQPLPPKGEPSIKLIESNVQLLNKSQLHFLNIALQIINTQFKQCSIDDMTLKLLNVLNAWSPFRGQGLPVFLQLHGNAFFFLQFIL